MQNKFNIKMDLNKSGLDMFFTPYQITALEILREHPEGLNTRKVCEMVNAQTSESISRASIINSLAWAAENGILEYTVTTGKGGIRRIYRHKYDEKGLSGFLVGSVKKALETLYQG